MGLPVTIKVNFRGNVKRFVAPDLDKSEWESVEAWIKASFGISHFQVKYFDEDNEEISINSQEEYEEAVKSAEKQGNQLHMNVYKMKGQACGGLPKTEVKELKGDLRPAPPYPSRVKTVDKGTQVTPEKDAVAVKDNKTVKAEDEPPPPWFRSYMEKFKDEVVKEVVERMCNDFSGQCCTHKAPEGLSDEPGAVGGHEAPGPSKAGPSSLGYAPACSSCKKLTSEGAYKCSVCPSCILCEVCRHSHDPSHSLVRTKTPLSIPEHGMSGEFRFPRRGDRTVRKAERQRLKAERRQLKAEVKEIKKKLRLEKRGLQWSGTTASSRPNIASASTQAPALAPSPEPEAPGPAQGAAAAPPDPPTSNPERPEVPHTTLVPTMAALFLDENLPDGTRLEPGTKFIKYWKMRNSGTISWTSETKLKFMWGNLGVASVEKREVAVPLLRPGQIGVVSVTFVAPVMEGTYTSHWRLVHCGEQFGPRVWCSIVVDPSTSRNCYAPQSKRLKEEPRSGEERTPLISRESGTGQSGPMDYYFPSVDLLTAQDLLSFELLDINIVQELEKVPTNTPVDLTPCMSPLPHDGPTLERAGPATITADNGGKNLFGVKLCPSYPAPSDPAHHQDPTPHQDPAPNHDGGEDISGAQFLCETIIRSLALEEAPDHQPPRRPQLSGRKQKAIGQGPGFSFGRRVCEPQLTNLEEGVSMVTTVQSPAHNPSGTILQDQPVPEMEWKIDIDEAERAVWEKLRRPEAEDEREEREKRKEREEAEDWDEVSSQASTGSASSSDGFIIVLPDCFDTSRPLGDSMYSSALSHSGLATAGSSALPHSRLATAASSTPSHTGLDSAALSHPVSSAAATGEEADSEPEELGRATPEGEWQEESEGIAEGVVEGVAVVMPPAMMDHRVNQLLYSSQDLDTVPLVPEVVLPPVSLLPPAVLYSPRSEELYVAGPRPPASGPVELCQPAIHLHVSGATRPAGSVSAFQTYNPRACNALQPRGQGGITEGLVKGALSVAASAYKALFTGPSCSTQRGVDPAVQDTSMMAVLLEMGFRDQRLNQRLLRKHRYNLLHTINALVQLAEAEENRAQP